jgi:hypothetical protein
MRWDIINTQPIVPKCSICDRTTDQMARFIHVIGGKDVIICFYCGPHVKECMNKWKDLESAFHINKDNIGGIFYSDKIDSMLDHTVYDEK